MIKKNDVVLITGCGGMLGEAVYMQFKDICRVYPTDIDLNESWLTYLDVTDHKKIDKLLATIKPNYIIHLAALTDMEYCEEHPFEAYTINAGGIQNFASYTKENNATFLYISTAGIFDGKKETYNETDLPNAKSIYAKSKYIGELIAKDIPKSIIIRAGWMMGGGPKKDKKFINKIIKQIQSKTRHIFVVNDKFGTPCYTYDLAKSIHYLIDKERYGLYHGACDGGGSRFDIAKFLINELGLQDKITLSEVDSAYFQKDYFAPRPQSEQLLNTKLKKLNLSLTRDWRICLKEYIKKFDWKI